MLRRAVPWLTLGLSLPAAAQQPAQKPSTLDVPLAEAVVRAFRSAIRIPEGQAWYVPAYLCLSIGEVDPTDSLVSRLRDLRPPVIAASECERRFKPPLRPSLRDTVLTNIHRGTGRGVWTVSVANSLALGGPDSMVVRVFYNAAVQWAGGFLCTAKKSEGTWLVYRCWQDMISANPPLSQPFGSRTSRLTDPVKLTGVRG